MNPYVYKYLSQLNEMEKTDLSRSLVSKKAINKVHSVGPVLSNIGHMDIRGGTAVTEGIIVIAVGLDFRCVVIAGLIVTTGEELHHKLLVDLFEVLRK